MLCGVEWQRRLRVWGMSWVDGVDAGEDTEKEIF